MNTGLLIASPQMRDPTFERTVVLLCHHDSDGALGLVINRLTSLSLADVFRQLEVHAEESDERHTVHWGGPVEQGAGLLVFSGQVEEESGWNLPENVAVSTSRERLEDVARGDGPFFLCLGYAGWGPGQLESEIEMGSWLYTEVQHDLVFDASVDNRYDQALATLGLSTAQLWMNPVDE